MGPRVLVELVAAPTPDDSQAKKVPGFIKAVRIDEAMGKCTGWVVAVAQTFPAAMKAAKALKVTVDPGPYGKLSLNDIMEEFSAMSEKAEESAAWVREGNVGSRDHGAGGPDCAAHAGLGQRYTGIHGSCPPAYRRGRPAAG